MAWGVKNPPAMQETPFWFLGQKICWRRDRLPTPVFLGCPCGSAGKESTCNVGGLGSVPALGRSPGEGKGYPLQYSGLENSMDSIVHGVTKSRTQLSDFHFLKRILFINGFSLFIWLLRKLNRLFYVASQSFSINTPKEWLFPILHTYLNHLGDLKMWGFWVPCPEILNK